MHRRRSSSPVHGGGGSREHSERETVGGPRQHPPSASCLLRSHSAPPPQAGEDRKRQMKLASFESGGRESIGIVVGDALIDFARAAPDLPSDMRDLIRMWPQVEQTVRALPSQAQADVPLAHVRLLAPVPRPQKILAIGLNYDDHIAEAGREKPQTQTWFSKMPSAVNGPTDSILLPKASSQLDYEAELVFIIGKRCRHVNREDAASVIF